MPLAIQFYIDQLSAAQLAELATRHLVPQDEPARVIRDACIERLRAYWTAEKIHKQFGV